VSTPATSLSLVVDSFEERYVERARKALAQLEPARIESVSVLRKHARPAQGEGMVLAGWWCERNSDPGVVVLPNPWDQRDAIPVLEQYCWEMCQSAVADLGRILNEVHGVEHPTAYWEVLVLPWLLYAVSAIVDRRLFCLTAAKLAPRARWDISEELPIPSSGSEAVISYQTDEGNSALLTKVARLMDRPLVQTSRSGRERPPSRPVSRSRVSRWGWLTDPGLLVRGVYSHAVRVVLRAALARRVVLIGPAVRFAPTELLALRLRVPGLTIRPTLPFLANPRGHRSEIQPDWALRQCLSGVEAHDGREQLFVALLPQLLPCDLLEGYRAVVDASAKRYGRAAPALVANYARDAPENEFIARARSAGKPIAFAQHGGAYLQLRTHAESRLELRDDSLFMSWGSIDKASDGIVTAPDPRLAKLRDSHRGGDEVVIVEWVTTTFSHCINFTSCPQANQGYDVPKRLAEMMKLVKLDRRRFVLKPFPTFAANEWRPAALEALSQKGPSRSPSSTEWMRRSRVAVIPYPDTPFIEAMVIGVPTIGLWSPDLWQMRDDAAPYFEELAEVGVVHSDPEAAAAKLDAVYSDATAWWQTAEIQRARRRFLDRFAVDGDWRSPWIELLRGLGGADQ
jgi:putative transferase (TIGR04331 family)